MKKIKELKLIESIKSVLPVVLAVAVIMGH